MGKGGGGAWGGSIAQWLAYLLPAAPGLIPSIKILSEGKTSLMLRFINITVLRKVDGGLKMLIELN